MPRLKPPDPAASCNSAPLHEQVRGGRGEPPPDGPKLTRDPANLVPTGCKLMDIALSETVYGGWHLGTMGNLVGDTQTGKSILALSGLDACAEDERFDDFELIYDDTENAGNFFNMQQLFGTFLTQRIRRPNPKTDRLGSLTVEAFRANVNRVLDAGKPFIYVVDSLDGLSSLDEQERVRKDARTYDEDRPTKDKGSFKTEKPRLLGELLRVYYGDLQKTRGLLLAVSQVRENMDPLSFKKHRRNGGKALDHWCQHIVWMFQGKPGSHLTKQIWGKKRRVGHPVSVKVEKNRLTGREKRQVEFDLLQDYGVDQVGALVDWMTTEGRWKGGGSSKVHAKELGLEATRGELIDQILEAGQERKLAKVVLSSWLELERLCAVERKRARF